VLFIGRAQEKAPVFRTEKRRAADGSTYPWIVGLSSLLCKLGQLFPLGWVYCA
jgi:hypothetical protein